MIREYRASDFEDVLYLQRVSYESPCTASVLREKLAGNCWVATLPHHSYDVGEVIGACIVCPETDTRNEADRGRSLLWSITVAPAQRNKGWGSALIREASKHFLALYLYVDTESPARHLYEREGFKVEKFLYEHYGKKHAYLMRKSCLL